MLLGKRISLFQLALVTLDAIGFAFVGRTISQLASLDDATLITFCPSQLIVVLIDPHDSRLSIYFSKLRVAVMSRVKTAMIVESDTLVYSSDELFPVIRGAAHCIFIRLN
jgi:hypothetical protein